MIAPIATPSSAAWAASFPKSSTRSHGMCRETRGATPVYADGYGSPVALDWDPPTATLWVADRSVGAAPFAFYRGAAAVMPPPVRAAFVRPARPDDDD